jgi:hypothetical protein
MSNSDCQGDMFSIQITDKSLYVTGSAYTNGDRSSKHTASINENVTAILKLYVSGGREGFSNLCLGTCLNAG